MELTIQVFHFPWITKLFHLNSHFFLSHTRSIDNPKLIVRKEKKETTRMQNKRFRQTEIHLFCLPQHTHLMVKLEDATNWQQISGEVKGLAARNGCSQKKTDGREGWNFHWYLVRETNIQDQGYLCILLDYLHCTLDAEFQNIHILLDSFLFQNMM